MAYYQNWASRFIFRKNFLRRVNYRLQGYRRRLMKDEFDDLAFLLADRAPRVIFDCGANIGFVTHRFLELFPSASVHAFEPNPAVFGTLAQTYQHDARVTAMQVAVSRQRGRMAFRQNANSGTSSFYEATPFNESHWSRKGASSIEVDVVTLDEYASDRGIEAIDILKLDLEGSEVDALVGVERMLEAQRVGVIYVEVALVPLYRDQPLLEDIIRYLREKGYFLYNLYGFSESKIRQGILGNATFLSGALRDELARRWGVAHCGW